MNKMGYPVITLQRGMLEKFPKLFHSLRESRWDRLGKNGLQWPVAEDGTDIKILHTAEFKRGKGILSITHGRNQELTAHSKNIHTYLPPIRELEHYNCGAMTRRTANEQILSDDYLLIHPEDADAYFIKGRRLCLFGIPKGESRHQSPCDRWS